MFRLKCPNTLKEIQSYTWRKNRDGTILDVPVKLNDHAMDAMMYCIYGMLGANSPYKCDGTVDLDEVSFY